MSLIYCPECGHEISNSAVACPNCGRPIHAPVPTIERNVVVAQPPVREGFPPWVFVPLGILGVTLLFVLVYLGTREDDDANSNLSVRVGTNRTTDSSRDVPTSTSRSAPTETQTINVPPTTDTQTITVPGSQSTTTAPPADKGTVLIDAKIATRNGSPQAVRNEKFYLLDEDLESILSDANLVPIEGQSLKNSFGLSVVYPERYGDFNRDALRAIKSHIKYSGQTDTAGKAQLGGVEPNSYYLFGVTKTGRGFAIWNSQVTVINGQNVMNLNPQSVTEMEDSSGE